MWTDDSKQRPGFCTQPLRCCFCDSCPSMTTKRGPILSAHLWWMDGPLPALLSSWPEFRPPCHGADNCLLNSGGRPHTHSRQPRASSEAQALGHVALHWAGLVCDFRLEPQRAEVPVPVAAVFPNTADLAFCGRVGRWTRAVRRPRGPWSADVEEEGPETGGLAREPGRGRETPRLTHTHVHTHVHTRSHAA